VNANLKKANLLKKSKWSTSEFKEFTGKESDLQNSCEELLQYYPDIATVRIPDLLYFVLFSGKFKIIDRSSGKEIDGRWYKKISAWLKGLPDLVLIKKIDTQRIEYGKRDSGILMPVEIVQEINLCMCAELKTTKGRLTKHQKKFGEVVNLLEFRAFEEFEKRLKEFSDYGR